MFKYIINPQITNARNNSLGSLNIYYFKFKLSQGMFLKYFFCIEKLSMLVGISEAICVIFILLQYFNSIGLNHFSD
jgi:hypothetical protein